MNALRLNQIVFRPLGFRDLSDLVRSTLKPKMLLVNLSVSSIIAAIILVSEKYLGLSPELLWGFLLLNLVEFYTGVQASKKEGKKFMSSVAHRFFIKTMIYLVMLHLAHMYSTYASQQFPKTAYLYDFAWYIFFNGVSLILFRSVFENLHRMQVKEAKQIYDLLNTRYTRFLADITAPPDDEKKNR
jgi:phage-related holin